jgi:Phytanoyl-CoA dioxygenase (PhyH)
VRRGGRLTIAAPVVEMLGGGEPDWAALSTPERVMCLELLGYVVLPGAANGRCLDSVARELDALPLAEASYSCHQRYAHGVQWSLSREVQRMIDLPAVVEFATALFGDELVCTGCTYAITEPGYPGMAVHTDSQPYGSKIFGMQSSAPRLVRALTYLDGTSAQRAPLMVVPCSQLSMHVDAQPYRRYLDHPDLRAVTCEPGSTVVIDQRVFHAAGANISDAPRRLFAAGYRPVWAGPIAAVPEHDASALEQLCEEVRPLFRSPNVRRVDLDGDNRAPDMPCDAFGLGLSRWSAGPSRAS